MGTAGIRRSIAILFAAHLLCAGEHRGVVKLGTLPVPGATVTARQGEKTFTALTDTQGAYLFPDLADGKWTVQVEMRGFAPLEREVQSPGAAEWNLTILPMAKITESPATRSPRGRRARCGSQGPAQAPAERCRAPAHQHNFGISTRRSQRLRDSGGSDGGLRRRLAARRRRLPGQRQRQQRAPARPSPRSAAFGNNRAPRRWRYNGNVGLIVDNSPSTPAPIRSPARTPRAWPTTALPGLAYSRRTPPDSRPAAQWAEVHR